MALLILTFVAALLVMILITCAFCCMRNGNKPNSKELTINPKIIPLHSTDVTTENQTEE